MFTLTIKRILRSGFVNFWRQSVISLAAILSMVITLLVAGSLILGSAFLSAFVESIRDKVDVTVYFELSASQSDIDAIAASLRALPEVKELEFISREEALAAFKERHEGDGTILAALDEIGDNPLRASMNIKARELSQYESVANYLNSYQAQTPSGASVIEKVNYHQNKVVIERLGTMLDYARRVGIALVVIFAIMSVLVTVNTISLALYTAREEIAVMKLVGAGNNFVRGPFVVQGAMYGVVSALVAVALLYPLTLWLGDVTAVAFGGINLFAYYVKNFSLIFFSLLGFGIVLGALSSALAIIKYLKV